MNKKKNPPGILDWIADFFVSPIKNAIADVVSSLAGEVTKAEAEGDVEQLENLLKESIELMGIGSPGQGTLTPDGAHDKALEVGSSQDIIREQMAYLSILTEIISIGQLDVSPGLLWQVPTFRSTSDIVYDIHRSGYDAWLIRPLQRYYMKKYTPSVPEPYRLAEMASKNLITSKEFYIGMAENGLDDKWSLAWALAQTRFPSPELDLVLLRRGIINDKDFVRFLVRESYAESTALNLLELKSVIPPIEDLRLMAVREAFPVEPGPPQYKEMEKWAIKMGLDPFWTERYLIMGFRRMDVNDAMRYFLWYHDEPKAYEDWLRIADIHPDDRGRVTEVSYTVPSIRELGYGFDVGDYTEEDIVAIRRRGGLNPVDAVKAGHAMVTYRTEAEREAVRREWLHLYALGKRTDEEFTNKLLELRTSPEATVLWLERGVLEKERREKEPAEDEYRIVTGSDALWALEHGTRSEEWVRSKLKDLLWSDERIQLAIDEVEQRLLEKVKPIKVVTYRDLTISQLSDLYWRGKKELEDVIDGLEAIGYSVEDALDLAELIIEEAPTEAVIKPYTDAWARNLYAYRIFRWDELYNNYLALDYDAEHASNMTLATILSEEVPALQAAYRKGIIDDETFLRELVYLGMEGEDAIELLDKTIRDIGYERIERERDLTKAEIIKGVKNKIITPTEGTGLLEDLGYEAWEAQYVLAIEGIVSAGDPEGYWEMRKVTEAYKKARGEPYRDIPDDLVTLEKAIGDKKQEIKKAEVTGVPERKIAALNVELGDLEKTMRARIISEKLE